MPQVIQSTVACLARSQAGFLRTADEVPAAEWKTRPSEDRWSAAELVAHLMMVERAVVGKADRIAQKAPKHFPWLKKIHLPIALVHSRIVRRKSPVPVDPEMLRDKEDMMAELREVRGRTLAFLEEMKSRDLSEYVWKHPALGNLNTYEWIKFLAAHEVRHTKQMREIADSLPKFVETLQK
ncbi:MAG: DinB family protein [Candidatus Acidiferrum sp.]